MNLEEFVSRGQAAQKAVDENLRAAGPETLPERPTINTELSHRLGIVRVWILNVIESEKTLKILPNTSFARSMSWARERAFKLAREAINEFGPLSKYAQESEFNEFVASIDRLKLNLDEKAQTDRG